MSGVYSVILEIRPDARAAKSYWTSNLLGFLLACVHIVSTAAGKSNSIFLGWAGWVEVTYEVRKNGLSDKVTDLKQYRNEKQNMSSCRRIRGLYEYN